MKIPLQIPLDRDGQYCWHCFEGPVERFYRDNQTYYRCQGCHKEAERSLVIDHNVTWWVDADRTYWHESVGVVAVWNGKILVMLRQIFPFAYALPAGHLDAGEKPEPAALRELAEEMGITQQGPLALIKTFDMPGDSCRRGSDHHRWHLYRLGLTEQPQIVQSDESSQTRWLSIAECLALKNLSFPLRYILENFSAAQLLGSVED